MTSESVGSSLSNRINGHGMVFVLKVWNQLSRSCNQRHISLA